jgi:toxin-antitoxin system PIN domain toxin
MATDTYLLDVNVLIALAWPQHLHHGRAHAWFSAIGGAWATTPLTETAFVRLSTTPAVVSRELPVSEALEALRAMRSAPGHLFIADDSSLGDSRIALDAVATRRQIADAHLVNLAARSGAVLATLDRTLPAMLEPADRIHVLVLPDL